MANFKTKEEYIVWRANWKIRYKDLSKKIREQKRTARDGSNSTEIQATAQSKLHYLKIAATAMMEQRTESKVEAQKQYLKAKKEQMKEEAMAMAV